MSLPFAIAVAVLRYRLFEIDRIVSPTVTYGVVTALLVMVSPGSVFILRSLVPVEGQLAVAGSTLATAALFNPGECKSWWTDGSTDPATTRSRRSQLLPADFETRLTSML